MKQRLILLFLVSVVLHVLVVLSLGHYRDARLWENGAIAMHVFDGKGFSADFAGTLEPTSWQAPFYPYLLASAWSLGGKTPSTHLVISLLQCLAIASMIWPMTWLSQRWFPKVPVWPVQLFVILAPLYLWYPTRLHHTAFVMALQPWLLWMWLTVAGRGLWPSVAAGALTGLAGLIQPVLLGVFGLIGLSRLLANAFTRQWRTSAFLIVAGLTVVACLVPWTVRNYQAHGRIILVKNSFGKEFWMGNNPHATGTGYALGGAEEITNAFPPKALALRGSVSEMQLMDALKDEAKEWVATYPGAFLSITAKKVLWFWTLPPKDRVRSTGDAEALLFRGVYVAYWAIIAALAFVGIIAFRPPWQALLVIALFSVFYSAIYGLTQVGQARFRGEIEYLFLIPAAAGFFWLLSKVWKSKE